MKNKLENQEDLTLENVELKSLLNKLERDIRIESSNKKSERKKEL
jgi:hypothetical protein